MSKVCQGAKTTFFFAQIGAMATLCSRYLRFSSWRYLLLLPGRCVTVCLKWRFVQNALILLAIHYDIFSQKKNSSS